MNITKKVTFGTIVVLFFMVSCVPVKQFTEMKSKAETYQKSNDQLKEDNQKLTVEINELDGKVLSLQKRYFDLENEFNKLKKERQDLQEQNESLSNSQKEFELQLNKLKEGSSDEISKLLGELQIMQGNLQDRENRVKTAEEGLKDQEMKMKEAQDLYNQQQAKLVELQTALNKQKDAMEALKGKLNQALRGFYDQGLTVHEKNGKIYVSLEEQLLFKTGSYSVDPKGQEAIKKLSEVLANNPDINIMVEGHTDDVPLTGSGQIKDNWDLSVMRATAVCQIILNNKTIDPKRITTSGRSQYVPLDAAKTTEARKKNRRTEIILTPNLSEVLQLIQSN
jgi:chemotaxis protein MotB